MNRDIQEYYSLRAREYEKVYAHPAKQADIAWLRGLLQRLLAGRNVLEATCGTGYWTPAIAEVRAILDGVAKEVQYFTSTFYWCVSYKILS